MKKGDIIKLYNVAIGNKTEESRTTRIKSVNKALSSINTTCGLCWWVRDFVDKGEDYEILSFNGYLRLIKI